MTYVEEVVKSFRFCIEGMDTDVQGEVRKQVSPDTPYPYRWSISHHYRPTAEAMGIYYPSRVTAESAEEAEILLLCYAQEFTAAFGVSEG